MMHQYIHTPDATERLQALTYSDVHDILSLSQVITANCLIHRRSVRADRYFTLVPKTTRDVVVNANSMIHAKVTKALLSKFTSKMKYNMSFHLIRQSQIRVRLRKRQQLRKVSRALVAAEAEDAVVENGVADDVNGPIGGECRQGRG